MFSINIFNTLYSKSQFPHERLTKRANCKVQYINFTNAETSTQYRECHMGEIRDIFSKRRLCRVLENDEHGGEFLLEAHESRT